MIIHKKYENCKGEKCLILMEIYGKTLTENIYNNRQIIYNYVYFRTSLKGGDKVEGSWKKTNNTKETKAKHLEIDIEKLEISSRNIKSTKRNT